MGNYSGNSDFEGQSIYFGELKEYSEPLSLVEELELGKKMERGDSSAREELVVANLRYVVEVASKFTRRGVPLEDLIQIGNQELNRVVDRYDWRLECKFTTFATKGLHQRMESAIRGQSRMVKFPANVYNDLNGLRKLCFEKHEEFEEGTIEKGGKELGMTKRRIQNALDLKYGGEISLDYEDDESEKGKVYNLVYDKNRDYYDLEWKKWDLDEALSTLDERDLEIIKLNFGLEGNGEKNLTEIAKMLKISKERVRQLKERALRKLKEELLAEEDF